MIQIYTPANQFVPRASFEIHVHVCQRVAQIEVSSINFCSSIRLSKHWDLPVSYVPGFKYYGVNLL